MTGPGSLRLVVLTIAGIETIAAFGIGAMVIAGGALNSGEQLSRSIGWAIISIVGLPLLCTTAPALLLATLNRNLRLALALSLFFFPVLWLLWWIA